MHDLISFSNIAGQLANDLKKDYEKAPWESFYEKSEKYKKDLTTACAVRWKKILNSGWRVAMTGSKEKSQLFPAVAVYYVNSQLLRNIVGCPCLLHPRFQTFFTQYAKAVGAAKHVVRKEAPLDDGFPEDHFVGIIANALQDPDRPIVVSLERDSAETPTQLHFYSQIKLKVEDLKGGKINDNALQRVRKVLNHRRKRGKTLPRAEALRNLIAPVLQFPTGRACFGPRSNKPKKPFHEIDGVYRWPQNLNWRAVHFFYVIEQPAFHNVTSGCTVMVIETDTGSLTVEVSKRLTRSFIPAVRAGMSFCLAHVVSRLEARVLSGAQQPPGPGLRMVYPRDFAWQPDDLKPTMPLLDYLKDHVVKGPEFSSVTNQLGYVVSCLTYLVGADDRLTTGYRNIAGPISHVCKKLWFSWKTHPPRDLEKKVHDWSEWFRKALMPTGGDLDERHEPLLQVLELALGIENDLSEIPTYREHFVHSFHVFCLGLCVLSAMESRISDRRDKNQMERIVKLWFLAAFWHDVSYAVEKLQDLGNRYVAAMQREKPSQFTPDHHVRVYPSFGHLLVNDAYFEQLQDAKSRFLTPKVFKSVLGPFGSINSADVTTLKTLQRVYRHQLIDNAQHGILSGLVFLDNCESLSTAHGISEQELGRVALSIMFHHMSPKWFGDDKTQFQCAFRKWKAEPWKDERILLTLLILCDGLAQWGRNFEYATSERCCLEKLTLNDGVIDMTIRYPFTSKKLMKDKYGSWYNMAFGWIYARPSKHDLIRLTVKTGGRTTPEALQGNKTLFIRDCLP